MMERAAFVPMLVYIYTVSAVNNSAPGGTINSSKTTLHANESLQHDCIDCMTTDT